MNVTIMITTRNRVVDLARTCRVLRQLSPAPLEILITADGCTDDTVSFVKEEMPRAKLIVNATGRGSIASRDRMVREARGDLIFALDDDSYPEQADCLDRIIPLFGQRPRLAVLHFPQRTDEYPETLKRTDFGPERATRSFASSGAVLRRSIYLELPGFEPLFFHAYEEPDYALQCLASGYEVLLSSVVTIRHHFSSITRNEIRTHHNQARNEFWSALIRCPFPQVLMVTTYRIFSQFRYACKRGLNWVVREPIWWWRALGGIPSCLEKRQAVSWRRYSEWLRLP